MERGRVRSRSPSPGVELPRQQAATTEAPLDTTHEYNDAGVPLNETVEYPARPAKEPRKTLLADWSSSNCELQEFFTDVQHDDDVLLEMFTELASEFSQLLHIENEEYLVALVDGVVFRVDKDTDVLNEHDVAKYIKEVEVADRAELKQFIQYNVFQGKRRSDYRGQSVNTVDCI